MSTKATVVTPGGRIGNDRSTGSRANGRNWVEEEGGLPRYIRIVRNGLMKEGRSEGQATALAVAAIKRWARGGDNVSPKVQAAAAAALAQWEKMKASARSKSLEDELDVEQKRDKPKKQAESQRARNWDEEAHPRAEAGSAEGTGGQFVAAEEARDNDKAGDGPKDPDKYDLSDLDAIRKVMRDWRSVPAETRKALKARMRERLEEEDASPRLMELFDGLGQGAGSAMREGRRSATEYVREKRKLERFEERAGSGTGDDEKDGGVPPKKRAEPKRGKKDLFDELDGVSDVELKEAGVDTLLLELHDDIDNTVEVKEASMEMEFKTVGVNGMQVDDEEHGIVTTFVSVTGLQDNVKDVIHPGAYEKSLMNRIPKGVWSHSWDTPVSKTLDVKELHPGDPELPKKLPNGSPWPVGAGALKVKTQFNLDTQRGREAYSDVIFFGDQQEWSIGYQVPVGGARIDSKTGVRHIDYLELYEYSPVLFGAMSAARTANPAMAGAGVKSFVEFDSVRDAQTAYRNITMSETDFKQWTTELGLEWKGIDLRGALEVKGLNSGDGSEVPDEAGTEAPGEPTPDGEGGNRADAGVNPDDVEDEAEDWASDEEDDPEGKALPVHGPTAYDYDFLVKARTAIDAVLDAYSPEEKEEEAEDAGETKSLLNIIERHSDALGEYSEEMKAAAEAFDTAYDIEDPEGMDDFGNDVLEVVEKALDAADEEDNKVLAAALQKVAAAVASMAPQDEEDLDNPEEVEDEDDTEKKPIPPRPTKKDAYVTMETKELDTMRVAIASMLKR